MKVWITKYAVSSGIKQIEAEMVGDGMVQDCNSRWSYYHHDEFCLTEEEARVAARALVAKRIASLKKSLIAAEKIRF